MSSTVCTCPRDAGRADVLGVPIDLVDGDGALARLRRYAGCPATHVVHHLSADPLVRALDDAALAGALRAGDLNVADGMSVVFATRVLGPRTLRSRVYGPDLMRRALAEPGLTHGLIGGTPDVLDALARRFPVSAAYAPPMRALITDADVASDVAALGSLPDVLWVGLGTPKQQVWAELARRLEPARAIVTVGAAFDFLSGAKRQAPGWMQRSGFEWAFRLGAEPRRLWRRYLIGNPRFVAGVVRQRLERR